MVRTSRFKPSKMKLPRSTRYRVLVQARKSGKGVTDAVALDQEPEGVNAEGKSMYFVSGVLSCYVRLTHSKNRRGIMRFRPETFAKFIIGATASPLTEREVKSVRMRWHNEGGFGTCSQASRSAPSGSETKAQQELRIPGTVQKNKHQTLLDRHALTEKEAEAQEAEQRVVELEVGWRICDGSQPTESKPEALLTDSGS